MLTVPREEMKMKKRGTGNNPFYKKYSFVFIPTASECLGKRRLMDGQVLI